MLSKKFKLALLSNRASFFAAGMGIAAWAPMIPYVKERFLLDEHTLGLLLLCVGAGSFSFMPLCSFLSWRLGCKLPCIISAFGIALCLCIIAVVQNVYLLALVLFIMGCFSVTLDVVSNINAAKLELELTSPIMSGMHGLYSVGGFCGSLGFTALLTIGLPLLPSAIVVMAVLMLLGIFGFKGLYGKDESEPQQEKKEKSSKGKTFFHPLVLTFGVLCYIMFMTEGSIMDWSGVFLNEFRGVELAHAGYGFAAFSIAMTIFRLSGDRIVRTFGRKAVLVSGALIVIAGYLLAVMCDHYLVAFAGFFLIGVGASNIVPQLVSAAASIKEVPVHVSVSVVNAIGITGSLMGPALIGFIAHQITLPHTYLVQALLVLGVALTCFKVLKSK